MVQSQSLSTLTICGSVKVSSLLRNRLNSVKASSLIGDRCVSCQFLRKSPSFRSHWKSLKQRNLLRVEARWPFQGGGEQGLDPSSERSESANEDILIFFFQLDLATRVQVKTKCRVFISFKMVANGFDVLQYWMICGLVCFEMAVCNESGAVRHCATTKRKANWGIWNAMIWSLSAISFELFDHSKMLAFG